jgi:hypothetical protein
MSLAPPMRTQARTTPVVQTEQPEVTKLHDALQQLHARPNTITLAQFQRFAPLFRVDSKLTAVQIEDLTALYRRTFDFYKTTVIIESAANPKVIETLPPLFTPVKTLSPNQHNATLVDINAKLGTSGVPLHSVNAFGRMADAIIAEQAANRETVLAYQAVYVATVNKFLKAHGGDRAAASTTAAAEVAPVVGNTTWSFDEE